MAAKAEEAQKLLDSGKADGAKNMSKDALVQLKKGTDKAAQAAAAKTLVKACIESYKLEEAQEVADTELAAFKAAEFTPGIIAMSIAGAEVAIANGKFKDSLALSRQAWPLAKKSGEKKLQAEVLLTMIAGLTASGQYKEALRAAESSKSMVGDTGAGLLMGQLLQAMGTLQLKCATAPEALKSAEDALAIFTKEGSKRGMAQALTTLGMANSKLGKFDEAIGLARQALDIWRPMGQASGAVAALEVINDAKAGEGIPASGLKEMEDELANLKKEGINPKGEVILLEKMVSVALDQGYKMEAISKMEDMILVLSASGDKLTAATKTMQLAEIHLEANHIKDAAKEGEKAMALFAELGAAGSEESAKKFVTSCYATLGQVAKSPYRSAALLALKGFVKAVEEKDVAKAHEYEVELDKASAALRPDEVNGALEGVILKDQTAMKFLEELGWNVDPFKTPETIYQFPHEVFYLSMIMGGMGFGPTFRGVYPYRRGKRSDGSGCFATSVNQMPVTEAWQGTVTYRHGLMDATLQQSGLSSFPPY